MRRTIRTGCRAIVSVGLVVVVWAAAVLTVTVVQAKKALACSCAPSSEQQLANAADVVFDGVAAGRHDPNPAGGIVGSGDPISWTFDVSGVIKGAPTDPQEVRSARGGATCGISFELGPPYRVFARRQADQTLATDLCSGTRALSSPPPPEPPSPPGEQTHAVVRGEWLWKIARAELRARGPAPSRKAVARAARTIYAANRAAIGRNPNRLRPGTVLVIPKFL
jgi:nucleoid-associated protein YgaU